MLAELKISITFVVLHVRYRSDIVCLGVNI
jgi:hypothetical protein